jgi:hypothetical protein
LAASDSRKSFDANFSREVSCIDNNYNVGSSSFLPPINRQSKKNLMKIQYLNIDDHKRVVEGGRLNGKIHAFDPTNLSMPKYSAKYAESNAAAVRHLLGGRRLDGGSINQNDIRNSNVHWMLGLRNYETSK